MNQLVFIENGKTVTDSLTVAEVFGKRHADVLRSIHNLECSDDFNERNFASVDYLDGKGESRRKVVMSQDGFSFLVMGYTGKEAAKFKEMYIAEFNRMREKLTQRPQTQLEILQASIGQLVEQERRLTAVEKRLDDTAELLSMTPINGRQKVIELINKIAESLGGREAYQQVWRDSYERLKSRVNCKLNMRLENKKDRLAKEGASKTKINKLTKLDVIFDDVKLAEIYISIVKEMAIQYNVKADAS
ncbi:Rha family transcriptional regulator [Paenibacillus larvae]|uniref:DNA binding antirepressor n=8 Tax=Fernvirus TaxID=2843380 RepID=A0A0K2CXT4_9CAUD|nr:Rha family transcriptional regulator [Paenibacillus larvae]YP_009203239.1 Rha family transcriptional regulator [Paenibacillus phage Fern]YP_009593446.1 Rha family transcriptional regulator [Paenibacillus phage Willow]YP_009836300.1 Rha family transcriptional regulator [Paenibacillus phage BN12]YP_009836517.1 Rha family transcriptional regulator [Paenibacillus phage Tadhana]YP_009838734.1 Rha family transcriptional regulator [Paenibacillus phage Kawika]YP_009838805.1 Rha family transcriptio